MNTEKILVLRYWPLNDGLTSATVIPRVLALHQFASVEKIVLVTVEKKSGVAAGGNIENLPKVVHKPLYSNRSWPGLISNIIDFSTFPKQLIQLVKQHNIQRIFAHGAPAGALAYKVWQVTNTPYYVSAFEPHADYMVASGVWSRFGLKYFYQKRWEQLQKKTAAGLMPVSEHYYKKLLGEGVRADKMEVISSVVEPSAFQFSSVSRSLIRQSLGFQNATVGVYLGKFGSLYYDEEAFELFKWCFQAFEGFKLIIISPHDKKHILNRLAQFNIEQHDVHLTVVAHDKVADFLSASDFAFAPVRSTTFSPYCSPIKIGEYWANGLPVLLTEGVGDDSDIIQREGGGATYNLQEEGNLDKALQQIQEMLKDPAHRQEIPKLARKYRSPERVREAYEHFFGQSGEEQR